MSRLLVEEAEEGGERGEEEEGEEGEMVRVFHVSSTYGVSIGVVIMSVGVLEKGE